MGKIDVLDEALINKIAAGEVIERPASVVKELIENALDAGAKKILVDLKDSGLSSIKVSDDGSGMDKSDAEKCILRHATSKIRKPDDLFKILTLGFRGEALSSIAAVSRLTIRTSEGKGSGIEIYAEAGIIRERKEIAFPKGTTIIAQDLFYNVPARKKHLKTKQAELRAIIDIVTRYSLIHPEVYIELISDENIILNSPPADTLGNISNIYGIRVAKAMIPVEHSQDGITAKGLVSKLGHAKKDKSMISIFVNRRYVRSGLISDALHYAYHTSLNAGEHPIAVLDISLNPEEIDVNIHPQKSEIKFEKEAMVYDAVFSAVSASLKTGNEAPLASAPKAAGSSNRQSKVSEGSSQGFAVDRERQSTFQENIADYKDKNVRSGYRIKGRAGQDIISDNASDSFYNEQAIKHKNRESKEQKKHSFRVIGQVLKTYIIIETNGEMMVVDQHAAEERVNYEKFMKQYFSGKMEVQELLEGITIDLPPADHALVDEARDTLGKLGFAVEDFGRNTVMLRTVPLIFERMQHKDILEEIIAELKDSRTKKLDNVREERIIRKACRASVKANDALSVPECEKLIERLFEAEQPMTCPHGRPTMIRFSSYELEKMFKRVV